MFHSPQIGLLLLLTHFMASITTGIIFRQYSSTTSNQATKSFKGKIISQKSNKINTNRKNSLVNEPLTAKNIGLLMGNAIQNSISTLLLICGYMMMSAILVNILDNLHIISYLSHLSMPLLSFFQIPTDVFNAMLKGFIEVTNGLKSISNIVRRRNNYFNISSVYIRTWRSIRIHANSKYYF
ncbi:MAG: hypothetical protein IJ215_05600 [Clostridia bacterium]|nr:hypothetical protein [Clostridia bacterium]